MDLASNVRGTVKPAVQRLGRLLPVSLYINRPLRNWPRILGVVHEIAVPDGVKPNPGPLRSGEANVNIVLDLLDRVRDVSGDMAECGVWRGRMLLAMALHVRQMRLDKRVLGFDSYAGFEEDAIKQDISIGGADTDKNRTVGGFSDTSVDLVLSRARRLRLTNIDVVDGFFSETLPKYQDRTFSFVHLDCDMYSSYKECLEFFYPRVHAGGIILFDEYNDPPWPGCNQAVDEFFRDKPEKPVRIVRDNFEKHYVVKQG